MLIQLRIIYSIFCAALFLSSGALAADAGQDVADAAKKLSDGGNYSWKAVTIDAVNGGTLIQEGKTEKNGYTTFDLNSGGYYVHLVLKAGAAVIDAGEGWKSADDLAGQRRASRFLSTTLENFKSPAILALEIAAKLKGLKPDEDAYGAEVSGKDAADLLGPLSNLRTDSEMTNAKATARFWVQNGILTKYEVHATGTISRNGNTTNFDRTITVDFSDVGTTDVEVPDEAKKKLG